MGLMQLLREELEHIDEAGFVERRIGSGGQTRLVTPPAIAAAISDSRVALCSKPGSRSRADRSTKPGAMNRPFASMVFAA